MREEVLARSWRCCCVCHAFAGRYINVHHIVQEADGGPNTIDNAIPLCDRCHSEAGHYNPRHPLGTKYSPSELKRLRDEWWAYMATQPGIPLPVDPLSIDPTVMRIPGDQGETREYDLRLINRSGGPLYAVSVQMLLAAAELSLELVQIGRTQPSPGREVTVNSGVTADLSNMRLTLSHGDGRASHVLLFPVVAPATVYSTPVRLSGQCSDLEPDRRVLLSFVSAFRTRDEGTITRPSQLDAGWEEVLMRFGIGETDYWIGLSAGPPTERAQSDE